MFNASFYSKLYADDNHRTLFYIIVFVKNEEKEGKIAYVIVIKHSYYALINIVLV